MRLTDSGPNLANSGPTPVVNGRPMPGQGLAQLRLMLAIFGRAYPQFGQVRPTLDELGPSLADFGPIWTNLGPTFIWPPTRANFGRIRPEPDRICASFGATSTTFGRLRPPQNLRQLRRRALGGMQNPGLGARHAAWESRPTGSWGRRWSVEFVPGHMLGSCSATFGQEQLVGCFRVTLFFLSRDLAITRDSVGSQISQDASGAKAMPAAGRLGREALLRGALVPRAPGPLLRVACGHAAAPQGPRRDSARGEPLDGAAVAPSARHGARRSSVDEVRAVLVALVRLSPSSSSDCRPPSSAPGSSSLIVGRCRSSRCRSSPSSVVVVAGQPVSRSVVVRRPSVVEVGGRSSPSSTELWV